MRKVSLILLILFLLLPGKINAKMEIPYQVFKTEMKESLTVNGDTILFYDPGSDRWSVQAGDGITGNIYYPEELQDGSALVKRETDTLTSGIFVPIESVTYNISFHNVGALAGEDYQSATLDIEYEAGSAYQIKLTSAEEAISKLGIATRDDNREDVVSHMNKQIKDGLFDGPDYRSKVSAAAPNLPNKSIKMIFEGGPFGKFSGSTKGNGKDVYIIGEIYNDATEVLLKPQGGPVDDYIAAGIFHLYPHDKVHVRIPIKGDGFKKWMAIIQDSMGECSDPENPSKDSGIRFSDIWGEVAVVACNGIMDEEWYLPELGDVLHVEDHIKTGDGDSGAILSLADMTTFKMRPETEIVLSNPPEKESKIALVNGKVWANLKNMFKDGSMEVEMSQAVAGIKGTTWIMEDDGEISTLKVIEGNVEIMSKATGYFESVGPGEAIMASKTGLSKKKTFDIAKENTNWEDMKKDYEESVVFEDLSGENNYISDEDSNSKNIIGIAILLVAGVLIYIRKKKVSK